jgi:GNAT superfamily N-acetyltransferase
MWWKVKRSEFERQRGPGNKEAMKAIVASGEVPGILAYDDGRPVGWCAVAKREEYPVLDRSRILKRVDETPVYAITCFFVAKGYRQKGMMSKLLAAVISYVKEEGGKVVEGFPVEPRKETMPDTFAWTGFASAFEKAGFVEVLRRSETRPIMRYHIE